MPLGGGVCSAEVVSWEGVGRGVSESLLEQGEQEGDNFADDTDSSALAPSLVFLAVAPTYYTLLLVHTTIAI